MSWGVSRTLSLRLSLMTVLFLALRLTIAVPTMSRLLYFVLHFTNDVQFGVLCLIYLLYVACTYVCSMLLCHPM